LAIPVELDFVVLFVREGPLDGRFREGDFLGTGARLELVEA